MNNMNATAAQARSYVYTFLAYAFSRPSEWFGEGSSYGDLVKKAKEVKKCLYLLSRPRAEEVLKRPRYDWMAVGLAELSLMERELTSLEDLLSTFTKSDRRQWLPDVDREHTRLFFGPGRPAAYPYESVYRDPDGLVMSVWAGKVQRLYAEEGLGLSAEYKDLPDQVAVELEFMAYLAIQEAEAWAEGRFQKSEEYLKKEERFLGEHLCAWLPLFCNCVVEVTTHPFYTSLARLAKSYVLCDWRQMGLWLATGGEVRRYSANGRASVSRDAFYDSFFESLKVLKDGRLASCEKCAAPYATLGMLRSVLRRVAARGEGHRLAKVVRFCPRCRIRVIMSQPERHQSGDVLTPRVSAADDDTRVSGT